MTTFFTQSNCDRCGAPLTSRIMSRFDTSCICPECEEEERRHPDYAKAEAAELAAIRTGNYNFPGIGWPGKAGRGVMTGNEEYEPPIVTDNEPVTGVVRGGGVPLYGSDDLGDLKKSSSRHS